jgi:hypothetical protein
VEPQLRIEQEARTIFWRHVRANSTRVIQRLGWYANAEPWLQISLGAKGNSLRLLG